MRRKNDASRFLGAGDLNHLEGLPKQQNLGKRTKRLSGRVESGKAHAEGDKVWADAFIEALRAQVESKWATHHFHSYPARFSPEGAQMLIRTLKPERMADPFCGGGTLVLEAMLHGATAFGSDLNPIATMVTQSRCTIWQPHELDDFLDLVDIVVEEATGYVKEKKKLWLPSEILKIKPWYKTNMFNEFAAIHTAMSAYHNEFSDLLRALFSSLLVKYSMRASDTSNKVVYTPRRDGTVLRAYTQKAEELARNLHELQQSVPPNTPSAQIELADAREQTFQELDTIATSPPYPGTYDYLPLQQLRLTWLGFETEEKKEIGARRAFKNQRSAYELWKKDTLNWMKSSANALQSGGKLAIIVGEGISRGRSFKVANPTKEAAEKANLRFIASGAVERRDPATQNKKIEYILAFEKP